MLALAHLLAAAACGSSSPAAPTPTTSALQVSAVVDPGTPLVPGETRQMRALATQSSGSSVDVTAQAAWQSSSPAIATISGAGVLTAVSEGDVDVSATYQSVRGSARMGVRLKCAVSIAPPSASYTAFGGTGAIDVSVSVPGCRWTVASDASWLPFAFEPPASGNGRFTYTLPPNSTTVARAASLVVTTATGEKVSHTVSQDRPLGCSYVTQPEEAVFTAAGGTGQFTVITTPGDCQWTLVNGLSALGVNITSGFSGTGGALVRYSVQAHTRSVDADGYLEIAGLSGLNPNGRHHIIIQKR